MGLIITHIEPNAPGGEPGAVLDCFEVPYEITEIILCGGGAQPEIAFKTADGTIIHAIDDDRIPPGTCPRCPTRACEGGTHTCANPVYA
jgi:hypothetical protein